ncbi:MAG: PLDc N-terminal domain-containing protein [Propionibacteriaceae bacterium]|jgi:heme/copper-type cytochrome/quinol oxidase subunit 4|nr:PLDc N-terminal domain-containing protein [Propionibacteriaceae bacterium]
MLDSWEAARTYLPILIPAAIIQLGLMVASLIHLATHPRVKLMPRWVWLIIIIVINTIGPILYFIVGRTDEEDQ